MTPDSITHITRVNNARKYVMTPDSITHITMINNAQKYVMTPDSITHITRVNNAQKYGMAPGSITHITPDSIEATASLSIFKNGIKKRIIYYAKIGYNG